MLFPRVKGGIFIDDLLTRAVGESYRQVIDRPVPAIKALFSIISKELKCVVAAHKTAVVASHPKLQSAIHSALEGLGGTLEPGAASNLGIDYYYGALRCRALSRKQLQIRQAKLKKRRRKLRALKMAGDSVMKLWRTGLNAYGHYGAQVLGQNYKELYDTQTEFLRWAGGNLQTRSRTLALLIYQDPSWSTGAGPALLWGSIVWRAHTCPRFSQLCSCSSGQARYFNAHSSYVSRTPGTKGDAQVDRLGNHLEPAPT